MKPKVLTILCDCGLDFNKAMQSTCNCNTGDNMSRDLKHLLSNFELTGNL